MTSFETYKKVLMVIGLGTTYLWAFRSGKRVGYKNGRIEAQMIYKMKKEAEKRDIMDDIYYN